MTKPRLQKDRHDNLTYYCRPMIGVTLRINQERMVDMIKLNAGFATIGQGAGPMMVTWKAGLFQKYGLDIEKPRIMGGAKGVVRGLMLSEIHFGNLAAPAPLRANLKGEADLVFLTGGINQQFIMGRPGIDRREQLAGKKIGFVGDGGLNDALVKFIIEKLAAAGIHGLHEEPIPAGGNKDLAALLSGTCDAIVITPPESIEAQRKGCKYLVDFAEYGLNYALGGIAARRDYVAQNPDDHKQVYQSLCRRHAPLPHGPRVYGGCPGRVQRHRRSQRGRGDLRPNSARHAEHSLPRGFFAPNLA